jgi:ATP-dependent helicase/nuclease subunit B
VVPLRQADDTAPFTQTAQAARAVARLSQAGDGDGLITEIVEKYRTWLEADYCECSWATVKQLCDDIATTLPGRREVPTARSVDVMEANDVWGLSLPYVIVAGLVDGEWPQPPDSVFPAAARERLSETGGPARNVRPRSGWTERRDFDQFADVVAATETALIMTYHKSDLDGIPQQPSPYIQQLETTSISDTEIENMLSDCILPQQILELAEGDTQ